MSRDARRSAIVAATIPLLVEHGSAVTTRQIATASGVAEGTLFRAFADKDELLRTAMIAALDPEPTAAAIRAVPGTGPLRDALLRVTTILAERQRTAMRVLGAAHQVLGSPHHPDAHAGVRPGTHARAHPGDHPGDARSRVMEVVLVALTERLGGFTDQLRLPCEQSARVLFSIVFGNALPIAAAGGRLGVEDIVDVMLHGIGRDGPGTDTDSSG